MTRMNIRIAAALIVLAVAFAVGTPPAAAQYYPAGGQQAWQNYYNQSRVQWEARRQHYLGTMNPVNRVAYNVENWAATAVHTVRTTLGDPDYGYYDRWDRKPVVSRGPNPYGGVYAGYGYSSGYPQYYPNTVRTNVAPATQYYQATPTYRPTYGYGVNLFKR